MDSSEDESRNPDGEKRPNSLDSSTDKKRLRTTTPPSPSPDQPSTSTALPESPSSVSELSTALANEHFLKHPRSSSSEEPPEVEEDIRDFVSNLLSQNSDEEREAPEAPEKTKPPYKWNTYSSARKREYGLSQRVHPAWFRYGAMGSLHMVERLELMYKLEKHEGCVNCLNFNASGTRLATGSDDQTVCLWDWTTGKSLLSFETCHRANVFQAKFMPLSGDCHIVTCARDGQVRLAELSVRGVCKSTRKLAQHRGAAHKLTVENDNPHVFMSCGEDALVYEIDLRDTKATKLLKCKQNSQPVALYSITSSPSNPNLFSVSGRDQFVRVYDRRSIQNSNSPMKMFCPDHLKQEQSAKTNITCVQYNYNGTELLASYNDEDIYTFDTEHSDGADSTHRFRGHRNNATVKGVNYFGARSEFIVSGSDCGHVFYWERESEKIVQFMAADEGGVINCLEPHPTCPVIATSGLDHDVKIWIPSCENPKFDARELKKLTKRNTRERERERSDESIDTHMLWFLISRMHRASGRAEREGEDDSSDGGSDSDDEEEEGARGRMPVQCRTQ